jgi:hypothetical protein
MGSYGKIIGIGLAVIAIIVASLGIYYHFYGKPAEKPFSSEPPPGKPTSPPDGKGVSEKGIPYIYVPPLKESDEWFRKRIKDFWSYPKLAEWLKVNDLIRRITAAVDNIADGLSPRPHLKFLAPGKGFTVVKKRERLYLNPQSYRRYDLVADAIASLDAHETVRVFREIKPLFQEAYRELGYPNEDFQDTLIRAIKELLGTPIVDGDIVLEQAVVTYQLADEDLEDLSDAQKHLLRMGPQNVRKIQSKLREMALLLGVPEKQLPKP